MHHTDLSGLTDKYDCLIIQDRVNGIGINEFCRRTIERIISRDDGECHDDDVTDFVTMRRKNVTYGKLLAIGAAVDVIDAYNLYLENGDGQKRYWCDCTYAGPRRFGVNCEYEFDTYLDRGILAALNNLEDIFIERRDQMFATSAHQKYATNGTCYIDLFDCHVAPDVCLHWNQICDGEFPIEALCYLRYIRSVRVMRVEQTHSLT